MGLAERFRLPLKTFGSGPMEGSLRRYASSLDADIGFCIKPTDAELHELLGRARAFIFPAIEDFGILQVEALAAGTPLVGIAAGGALDIVDGSRCGTLARSQSLDELLAAYERLMDDPPEQEECRDRSRGFTSGLFRETIQDWLDEYGLVVEASDS